MSDVLRSKNSLTLVHKDTGIVIEYPINNFMIERGGFLVWDMEWNYDVPASIDYVGRRDPKRIVRKKLIYMRDMGSNRERLNFRYVQRPS
jgi:hypothetical protein